MITVISIADILMERDVEFPLTPEFEVNVATLIQRVNKFLNIYARPVAVSSGYRPGYYNDMARGAPNSPHKTCEAVDLKDHYNDIKVFVLSNPDVLDECDLYMEHPNKTPTWVHFQTRPTSHRIFIP